MIALLALVPALRAAPPAFDRVELLSDERAGAWLRDEAPLARFRPATAAVRLLAQVRPTWRVAEEWTVGLSLEGQSLCWERRPGGGALGPVLGLESRLALPVGAVAGIAWRRGHLDAGLAVAVRSAATWRRPAWTEWDAVPSVRLAWAR